MFRPVIKHEDTYVYLYEKTKMEFVYCRNCNPLVITQVRVFLNFALFAVFAVYDSIHVQYIWWLHLGNVCNILSQIYFNLCMIAYMVVDTTDVEAASRSILLYLAQIIITIAYPLSWIAFIDVLQYPTEIQGEIEIPLLTVCILSVEILMTLHYVRYKHVIYPLLVYCIYLFITRILGEVFTYVFYAWQNISFSEYCMTGIIRIIQLIGIHFITTFICQKKYSLFTDSNQIEPGYTRIQSNNNDDDDEGTDSKS